MHFFGTDVGFAWHLYTQKLLILILEPWNDRIFSSSIKERCRSMNFSTWTQTIREYSSSRTRHEESPNGFANISDDYELSLIIAIATSETGNRTRIFRVIGGNAAHYTISERIEVFKFSLKLINTIRSRCVKFYASHDKDEIRTHAGRSQRLSRPSP